MLLWGSIGVFFGGAGALRVTAGGNGSIKSHKEGETGQIKSHRGGIKSHKGGIKSHRGGIKSHRAGIKSHRAGIKSHKARLKSHGTGKPTLTQSPRARFPPEGETKDSNTLDRSERFGGYFLIIFRCFAYLEANASCRRPQKHKNKCQSLDFT